MRKETQEEIFGIIEGQNNNVPTLNAEQVNKDYLKIKFYETKLRDNLLGDFSPNGEYKIVDEKIISALINIPKKFDDKKESIVYASTLIDDVVLNFRIEMNISESYCNANLSIIEIQHGVEEDVKHITRLDSFVDVYSPQFKEEVYKRWKVYFEEEVYEKDDFLKNHIGKMKEEFLFNKELTAILSQLYVMRMLKLLDNCGELGEKVKLEYKLLVEKILNKDASITQDYTRLKNILDYVIVKNKAMQVLLKMPDALAVMASYSTPIQRIKDKTIAPRVTEAQGLPEKKEEKKEEKKKSAPAKKKAKAKSGGKKSKPYVYDFKNFKTELKGSVKTFTYGSASPKLTPVVKSSPKKDDFENTLNINNPKENSSPNEEEMIKKFMEKKAERDKKLSIMGANKIDKNKVFEKNENAEKFNELNENVILK